MYVWLVESGDYGQIGVDGIYSSAEAAVAGIKAIYPQPPYIISWRTPRTEADGTVYLQAAFNQVAGYSTMHNASWGISRWELDGDRAPEDVIDGGFATPLALRSAGPAAGLA